MREQSTSVLASFIWKTAEKCRIRKAENGLRRIARFEKVSFSEFEKCYGELCDSVQKCDEAEEKKNQTTGNCKSAECVYDAIVLPRRATAGSAGYDFFSTIDVELKPGESVKIPTGIRAYMEPGWVLMLYPRSGLGFKYRMQLANTVGVIDSDYYGSDNEGHIQIKITNDSRDGKQLRIKAGDAFAQGVFTEYGITEDDDVETSRNGGFGSTSK